MARSPKTNAETEAVAEDVAASEADTAANGAEGTDNDGTWPIEDESAPAEPVSDTVQDQNTSPPSSTEDSLAGSEVKDEAEEQPAGLGITVTITGPKQGRWRAGRHFAAEPTAINRSDLTDTDLAALRADPMLTVLMT